MPQFWLSNLKKFRPLLGEILEGSCAERISKVSQKEISYVLDVAYGVISDSVVYALFWACVECHKEYFEERKLVLHSSS
jgi:hypothetical protein